MSHLSRKNAYHHAPDHVVGRRGALSRNKPITLISRSIFGKIDSVTDDKDQAFPPDFFIERGVFGSKRDLRCGYHAHIFSFRRNPKVEEHGAP